MAGWGVLAGKAGWACPSRTLAVGFWQQGVSSAPGAPAPQGLCLGPSSEMPLPWKKSTLVGGAVSWSRTA